MGKENVDATQKQLLWNSFSPTEKSSEEKGDKFFQYSVRIHLLDMSPINYANAEHVAEAFEKCLPD